MNSATDAGSLRETRRLVGRDGAGGRRFGERGVLCVDGVGVIGTESEFLEGAGVGHELGLPPLVGLVFLHGGDGGGVPLSVGLAGQIALANKGSLNLRDAGWVDGLLTARTARSGLCLVCAMRLVDAGGSRLDGRSQRGRYDQRRREHESHTCPA